MRQRCFVGFFKFTVLRMRVDFAYHVALCESVSCLQGYIIMWILDIWEW